MMPLLVFLYLCWCFLQQLSRFQLAYQKLAAGELEMKGNKKGKPVKICLF